MLFPGGRLPVTAWPARGRGAPGWPRGPLARGSLPCGHAGPSIRTARPPRFGL